MRIGKIFIWVYLVGFMTNPLSRVGQYLGAMAAGGIAGFSVGCIYNEGLTDLFHGEDRGFMDIGRCISEVVVPVETAVIGVGLGAAVTLVFRSIAKARRDERAEYDAEAEMRRGR